MVIIAFQPFLDYVDSYIYSSYMLVFHNFESPVTI